jgi:hypothetical protein
MNAIDVRVICLEPPYATRLLCPKYASSPRTNSTYALGLDRSSKGEANKVYAASGDARLPMRSYCASTTHATLVASEFIAFPCAGADVPHFAGVTGCGPLCAGSTG